MSQYLPLDNLIRELSTFQTRLLTANHVALSIALISILIGRDSIVPAVWIFAFFSGNFLLLPELKLSALWECGNECHLLRLRQLS